MVSVLRGHNDADSTRWPALTRQLVASAKVTSTATDRVLAQFHANHVYVECDELGTPTVVVKTDGTSWVHAYTRRMWVPGVDIGQDVDVLNLTGVELSRRLPDGTGVCLDPGHPHSLAVIPATEPISDADDDVCQADGGDR